MPNFFSSCHYSSLENINIFFEYAIRYYIFRIDCQNRLTLIMSGCHLVESWKWLRYWVGTTYYWFLKILGGHHPRGVYIAQKLKLFRGHQKLFQGCNIRSLTFTSTVKPHSFEGCHDIYMNISNMTSVCTSGIAASCHVSPSILPCMWTGELSIYSNKWVFLILE